MQSGQISDGFPERAVLIPFQHRIQFGFKRLFVHDDSLRLTPGPDIVIELLEGSIFLSRDIRIVHQLEPVEALQRYRAVVVVLLLEYIKSTEYIPAVSFRNRLFFGTFPILCSFPVHHVVQVQFQSVHFRFGFRFLFFGYILCFFVRVFGFFGVHVVFFVRVFDVLGFFPVSDFCFQCIRPRLFFLAFHRQHIDIYLVTVETLLVRLNDREFQHTGCGASNLEAVATGTGYTDTCN